MKPLTDRIAAPDAVRLRAYHAPDFARLCELDRICFSASIAYDADEIRAALLQPRTFCWVAERGAEVVGFILLHYRRVVGHIITIDIHPDFRRRGLGTQLMEMAERHLAKLGIRRVVLEVAVNNSPAIAFYHQRGYATQRLLRSYYRDGTDACLMEKVL